MNRFSGDITPAFASGNRGMQPLTDEQERLQRLLEAIILKTPGGVAKSIGEGIQTGVDVVGSIGQLDKAEQLGRQARRTLPDIVSAVTQQPGAVASALGQGLEQDVLDKGLGAFVGVEDAVPVVGKAGKFMGGIGAAAMMGKMPKMPKQAQDIVDASKRGDVRELLAEKSFSEIAKDSRDFDHFFYRTGGGKYDFGVAERLQNEPEGETGLVLGDFIIGKKVRELYSDALNTPIIILNTPVHKGKKVDLGDVDFFGASGSYKGQPAIFLSNDAGIKKNKIVGTILEEGAHTLRKLKGRQVQGAEQALKGDFDAYAASPEEVSAKKMVEFAAQLEEDKDGLLEFFNKATGSTSKMSKQAQDIVDASKPTNDFYDSILAEMEDGPLKDELLAEATQFRTRQNELAKFVNETTPAPARVKFNMRSDGSAPAQLLLTKSAKEKGKWQGTIVDEQGPLTHISRSEYGDVVKELSRSYPQIIDNLKNAEIVDVDARARQMQKASFGTPAYHGTTHDIQEFTLERSNPENYLGQAHYFSSSPIDASENYGGQGPDLTNRIDLEVENLAELVSEENKEYTLIEKLDLS